MNKLIVLDIFADKIDFYDSKIQKIASIDPKRDNSTE